MSGEDQQFEGKLKTGQTVKVAYFKQTDETLDRDIRMIDYLREESEVAKEKDGTSVSITQLLERFLFPSALMVKKFIIIWWRAKAFVFITSTRTPAKCSVVR